MSWWLDSAGPDSVEVVSQVEAAGCAVDEELVSEMEAMFEDVDEIDFREDPSDESSTGYYVCDGGTVIISSMEGVVNEIEWVSPVPPRN